MFNGGIIGKKVAEPGVVGVQSGLYTSTDQYINSLDRSWPISQIRSSISNYSKLSLNYFEGKPNASSFPTNPTGACFGDSGYKLYVSGANTAHRVYQYSLTTPYDIATATFVDSEVLDSQIVNYMSGIYFNDTGDEFFVLSDSTAAVICYTLNTPWDITSLVFKGAVPYSETQPSNIGGCCWGNSGFKLYAVSGGTDETLYEYTLSVAYDVSTATLTNSIVITAVLSTLTSVNVSSDGSVLYVSNASVIKALELTIPWDITSYYELSNGISLSTEDSTMSGIVISPDGRTVITQGSQNDELYQYSLTVPYDLSTKTFVTSVDISSTVASDLAWGDSGNYLYVSEGSYVGTRQVFQYLLTTPYTIEDGITLVTSKSFTDSARLLYCISFSSDGTKMYTTNDTSDDLYEYTLEPAWDINSAGTPLVANNVVTNAGKYGMDWAGDGSALYVCTDTTTIKKVTTNAPWSISGVSTASNIDIGISARSIAFSSDGSYVIILTTTNGLIIVPLSTPYDISTGYDPYSVVVAESDDFTFSSDGSYLYTISISTYNIYKYSLSTPYHLGSAVLSENISFGTSRGNPRGIKIANNDTTLYVSYSNNSIAQFNLSANNTLTGFTDNGDFGSLGSAATIRGFDVSPDGVKFIAGYKGFLVGTFNTPYDISTAGFDFIKGVFSETGTLATSTMAMSLSQDGYHLYVTNSVNIYQYDLDTPYDLSTCSYTGRNKSLGTNYGASIATDGTKILYCDSNYIHERLLTEAYNIDSMADTDSYFHTHGISANIRGLTISTDGLNLTYGHNASDEIHHLRLQDNSSLRPPITYVASASSLSAKGIAVDKYNKYLITSDTTNNILSIYEMAIPGSITSLSATPIDTLSTSLSGQAINVPYYRPELLIIEEPSNNTSKITFNKYFSFDGLSSGSAVSESTLGSAWITFSTEGDYAYVLNSGTTDSLSSYALSTPFDTSTATVAASSFSLADVTTPTGMVFNRDGTELYVLDYTNSKIATYRYLTPWDTNTIVYAGSTYLSGVSLSQTYGNLVISEDGKKLYILGASSIYEYDIRSS
jgi:sugar lactone lactonase YvrE